MNRIPRGEKKVKSITCRSRNSRITATSRYPDAGQEVHHRPPGSVMTVEFELDGQPFTALNGGPLFKFSEAISMQVFCDNQSAGGLLLGEARRL
jgi:predicted 3-demethylubiquinone-9 3-methyltransferase (glyoxalase superfamily)